MRDKIEKDAKNNKIFMMILLLTVIVISTIFLIKFGKHIGRGIYYLFN